ncbi:MAG TPA: class I SAM-dependent methyltransferase [Pyrinomonadaceae bacterium]|jgi:ubiquinone/menaquinone biosynthesis C-methylase UbiE
MTFTEGQEANQHWWQRNPMTYDWQGTLAPEPESPEWFQEVDRRFLDSAYYARGADGAPFGRYLRAGDVAGKDVLEVGCGMGTHAAMLAKAGARLTAIDLTQQAVQTTRRRFELFNLQGRIENGDAEQLRFTDDAFDMVWSWGVIHHSNSMEKCLSEITRVLRPGGRLCLMVYYRPSLVYYLHNGLIRGVLMGKLLSRSLTEIYTAASDGFYARVVNKAELRALLFSDYEQIKLSVVGLKGELFPIPRFRFKEWLEEITPDRLASAVLSRYGSMIVVEAVKK